MVCVAASQPTDNTMQGFLAFVAAAEKSGGLIAVALQVICLFCLLQISLEILQFHYIYIYGGVDFTELTWDLYSFQNLRFGVFHQFQKIGIYLSKYCLFTIFSFQDAETCMSALLSHFTSLTLTLTFLPICALLLPTR